MDTNNFDINIIHYVGLILVGIIWGITNPFLE